MRPDLADPQRLVSVSGRELRVLADRAARAEQQALTIGLHELARQAEADEEAQRLDLLRRMPDPDRRDDAVMRTLIRTHAQPWPQDRDELTGPELDTLRALADGCERQQAADELGYTLEGVKHHLKTIRRVLRARTNAHAVAEGFRRGLLR